ESRRLRFAHSVSDSFIEDYALRMAEFGSVVYCFLVARRVRAAAELRRLGDSWGEEAEAAFSVERAYQDQGIGTELMGRIVRSARNRSIRRLYMSCLAENSKMQAIARKHEADLRFEYGEVIGEIMPDTPNYFSIMAEAAGDRAGVMIAVLELQSRMVRAAGACSRDPRARRKLRPPALRHWPDWSERRRTPCASSSSSKRCCRRPSNTSQTMRTASPTATAA